MRIKEKFNELNDRGEGAYMPHIYYGDPSSDFSYELVMTLAENGADMLEFGIPFSDPTADGPTFQEACERALSNGATPEKCFIGIENLRGAGVDIPIILTTYYNIPYVYGLEDFFQKLNRIDVQGIIIPNIPLKEADIIMELGEENEIDIIFQVTPNTSEKRLKNIASSSSGFLYIINFKGVTGARESIPNSTSKLIHQAKNYTNLPLMAGFGISKSKHAKALVSEGVDGVITGSAIANIYEQNLTNPKSTLPEIGNFAKRIKRGCMA